MAHTEVLLSSSSRPYLLPGAGKAKGLGADHLDLGEVVSVVEEALRALGQTGEVPGGGEREEEAMTLLWVNATVEEGDEGGGGEGMTLVMMMLIMLAQDKGRKGRGRRERRS